MAPLPATQGPAVMLFNVLLMPPAADGTLEARAPALPGCDVRASSTATALPTLRLKIEQRLTELLGAGQPLPETPVDEPGTRWGSPAGSRWLTIHINVGHLVALAKHQQAGQGHRACPAPAQDPTRPTFD